MVTEIDHIEIEEMANFLPNKNEKHSDISRSQAIVIENNNEQQVYFAESEDGFKDSGKNKKASRKIQLAKTYFA